MDTRNCLSIHSINLLPLSTGNQSHAYLFTASLLNQRYSDILLRIGQDPDTIFFFFITNNMQKFKTLAFLKNLISTWFVVCITIFMKCTLKNSNIRQILSDKSWSVQHFVTSGFVSILLVLWWLSMFFWFS